MFDALHTVINSAYVQILPTEQATSVVTDFFSWGYDPYTHACKARHLTTVGRTSLSVIIIISRQEKAASHATPTPSGPMAAGCCAEAVAPQIAGWGGGCSGLCGVPAFSCARSQWSCQVDKDNCIACAAPKPALARVARRVMPLCTNRINVEAFVSSPSPLPSSTSQRHCARRTSS